MTQVKEMEEYQHPSELNNEELIKIVSTLPDEPKEATDVLEFITTMRFKPGRKRVPFSFILALYCQWSWKPTRKTTLGKELSKRFGRVRSRYRVYYLLSKSGLAKVVEL